jgi:hypothetical protein
LEHRDGQSRSVDAAELAVEMSSLNEPIACFAKPKDEGKQMEMLGIYDMSRRERLDTC